MKAGVAILKKFGETLFKVFVVGMVAIVFDSWRWLRKPVANLHRVRVWRRVLGPMPAASLALGTLVLVEGIGASTWVADVGTGKSGAVLLTDPAAEGTLLQQAVFFSVSGVIVGVVGLFLSFTGSGAPWLGAAPGQLTRRRALAEAASGAICGYWVFLIFMSLVSHLVQEDLVNEDAGYGEVLGVVFWAVVLIVLGAIAWQARVEAALDILPLETEEGPQQ